MPFWRWTQGITRELLGREPVPGGDYALTEVVHCGSQHETGVATALGTCTSRYLRRVLAASPAPVVIVVGATARGVFETQFRAQFTGNVQHPSPSAWVWQRGELAGRARCVLALPHPNARIPAHSVTGNLGPQLTADIARFISSGAPHDANDHEQPPIPAAEHRPAQIPQVYAITTRKRDRTGDPDLMPGLNYVVAAIRTPWKPGAIRVIHVTGTDPHWHPGQLVDLINAGTGLRLGQYEVRAVHPGRAPIWDLQYQDQPARPAVNRPGSASPHQNPGRFTKRFAADERVVSSASAVVPGAQRAQMRLHDGRCLG